MIEVMRSIPLAVRQAIYGVYAFVIFVIGGIQVWYATSGEVSPDWITNALAVGAYVGIGLGVTAAANATDNDGTDTNVLRRDGGWGLVEVAVAILVLAIALWVLFALLGNNNK